MTQPQKPPAAGDAEPYAEHVSRPRCPRCGARRWVGCSRSGPVEFGGQRLAQCVPCGHVAGPWTDAHRKLT